MFHKIVAQCEAVTHFVQIVFCNAVRAVPILVLVVLAGCASKPVDQIELMPAPDVYGDGMLNPLPEYNPFNDIPYRGILYATDRAPAGADDQEKYYLNDRGQILRVGVANVELGDKSFEWDSARVGSTLHSRGTSQSALAIGTELTQRKLYRECVRGLFPLPERTCADRPESLPTVETMLRTTGTTAA